MTTEKLNAVIEAIRYVRLNVDDETALTVQDLYPIFKADVNYSVGDRVNHNGILYKCLTSHTSQATWTPTDSPSLWVRVDDPSIEWPEWVQPVGSTDAYTQGSKVSHNDKHWISDVDNNVWEPGVYGWSEVI